MKNPYFKTVEIEKNIIVSFVSRHKEMARFVDPDKPFYVRVSKKPYAGLIHTIISSDASNEQVINQWQSLIAVCKKIKPRRIGKLSHDKLNQIVGKDKSELILAITNDILSKKINLKNLVKLSEEEISSSLKKYPHINLDIINQFLLFTCFKQNVLCEQDKDFIIGLKIFLSKEDIDMDDIKNIKIKYRNELTLFSLCM
ncbi:MAG: hypothetical protein MJ223_00290 [Mycoplasmoidaceae bacterium]|nr:hypothetical protein [Mycoplasmoidaceae bacterium]